MAAEDFFTRWSKKKTDAKDTVVGEVAAANIVASASNEAVTADIAEVSPASEVKRLPTQDDVDKLTHDSDYSTFMSQGVDESVKRSAMKKLFTDPHFNIMDGLDIYIDDYSKFEPITPELLASLNHAKALLDPLSQLKTPLMRLLEKIPETKENVDDVAAFATKQQVSVTEDSENSAAQEVEDDDAEQQTSQAIEVLPDQSSEEQCLVQDQKTRPNVDDV